MKSSLLILAALSAVVTAESCSYKTDKYGTVKGTYMTPRQCSDQFGYVLDDMCSGDDTMCCINYKCKAPDGSKGFCTTTSNCDSQKPQYKRAKNLCPGPVKRLSEKKHIALFDKSTQLRCRLHFRHDPQGVVNGHPLVAQPVCNRGLRQLRTARLVEYDGAVAMRDLVQVASVLFNCSKARALHRDKCARLLKHLTLGRLGVVFVPFNSAAGEFVVVTSAGFNKSHAAVWSSDSGADGRTLNVL
ncbi:hypothetical protein OQA88_7742 [Cercophora sp. LCS_1]